MDGGHLITIGLRGIAVASLFESHSEVYRSRFDSGHI